MLKYLCLILSVLCLQVVAEGGEARRVASRRPIIIITISNRNYEGSQEQAVRNVSAAAVENIGGGSSKCKGYASSTTSSAAI